MQTVAFWFVEARSGDGVGRGRAAGGSGADREGLVLYIERSALLHGRPAGEVNRFTTQSLHDSVGQTHFVNSVDCLANSVDRVIKLPG